MSATSKTFHFNFAQCVNSLVLLYDPALQKHWSHNRLLLSLHSPGAKTYTSEFIHIVLDYSDTEYITTHFYR